MSRLLITGCSAAKRQNPGPMPAVDLYDGPVFRLIRAARSRGQPLPRMLVISAAHGLIDADRAIETYDQRLQISGVETMAASQESIDLLGAALEGVTDLFVIAGEAYLALFDEWLARVYPDQLFEYYPADGGIGEKLGQLKKWLGEGEGTWRRPE